MFLTLAGLMSHPQLNLQLRHITIKSFEYVLDIG